MPSILSITVVCVLVSVANGLLHAVMNHTTVRRLALASRVPGLALFVRFVRYEYVLIPVAALGIWYGDEGGNLYLLAASIAVLSNQVLGFTLGLAFRFLGRRYRLVEDTSSR